MWCYLHNPTFSRLDTIPECDIQTRDDCIYRTSVASHGNYLLYSSFTAILPKNNYYATVQCLQETY